MWVYYEYIVFIIFVGSKIQIMTTIGAEKRLKAITPNPRSTGPWPSLKGDGGWIENIAHLHLDIY